MARRRRYYYRRKSPKEELVDIASGIIGLFILGLFGWAYTHREQAILYGIIATVVLVVGVILYFVLKKRAHDNRGLAFLSDDKILYMLKGMSPAQFEKEVADMFEGLGYKAEVVGGANDGGIDVIAHKDGKKYFIQCKKFITREVTPHEVRDFLGAITNINNPAEKGFFVTTGNFTMMAEKAAEGNPRIELIDGLKLIKYYRLSYGKDAVPEDLPAQQPAATQDEKICPQCGGKLELRTAHQGDYAGKQFWGCSNFPKCRYIKNIK
ncbi:MAG: restriction endonuclease [Patescibacteria group bacterium]|nr:restriction endonuclease [Patescibacteria group bacterium]MDE2015474.1 restriction endonuclease [Patescibacteria group bacterium]MDE2226910.1 restriction endonuclease [Patescibacteria group bacterium]